MWGATGKEASHKFQSLCKSFSKRCKALAKQAPRSFRGRAGAGAFDGVWQRRLRFACLFPPASILRLLEQANLKANSNARKIADVFVLSRSNGSQLDLKPHWMLTSQFLLQLQDV